MFDLLVLAAVAVADCAAPDAVAVRVQLTGFDEGSGQELSDELRRGLPQIGATWCPDASEPRVRVSVARKSQSIELRIDNRDSTRVVERMVTYDELPRDAPAFALSALVMEMMRGSWMPRPPPPKPADDAVPDLFTGVRRDPVWTEPPPPSRWDVLRASPVNVRAGALFSRLNRDLSLLGGQVSSDFPGLGALSATAGLGYLSGQSIESTDAVAEVAALTAELGLRWSPLHFGRWRLLSWFVANGKWIRFRPEVLNDDVSPTNGTTLEIIAGLATQYRYRSFFIEPSAGLGTALRGVDILDGDTRLLRAGRLTVQALLSVGFDLGG
ncbi:MAG: hypothetical protein AAFP04_08170 [Myxococcota bacterium]